MKNKNKIHFSFKLINNLIFIPVKVNGVTLTFLLDSGADKTILFSIDENNTLRFKNTEKITIKGFGGDAILDGLKSTDNLLEINGMQSYPHLLYIILGEEFNFSSHIGIPVNGIIGYSFFKNNLIKVDYNKKRITVYENNDKNRVAITRKFKQVPLTIESGKPYLEGNVLLNESVVAVKLLIDIGNSDSVWLFENNTIKVPNKNFEDYLGKGISGDVMGRRAQVEKFEILNYTFSKPIISFPDAESIKFFKFIPGRMGSVGGEILKRFTMVMDYENKSLFLAHNKMFNAPFLYNKSGIEIIHSGMQLVKTETNPKSIAMTTYSVSDSENEKTTSNFRYNFQLKPIYEITNIRDKSIAAETGLQKGDIIISINDHAAYKYSLDELNSFLKSDHEKWITIEVNRKGNFLVFKFKLVDVL